MVRYRGWIMGPWITVAALANGATLVTYDGAPDWPDPGRPWALVERHALTFLGVSPTLVRALAAAGDEDVAAHDRSSLRAFGSTGEPWTTDAWWWLFDVAGDGTRPIVNLSGGTEVGACLLSVNLLAGCVPCSVGGPALGVAVDVVDDDGRSVRRHRPGGGAGGRRAVAGHDPWRVGRPAALPRHLLVALRGAVVARRLRRGGRRRPVVPARPQRRHPQRRRQAHRPGRDRVGGARRAGAVSAAAVGLPHPVKGEAVGIWCVPTGGPSDDPAAGAALADAVGDAVVAAFGKASGRRTWPSSPRRPRRDRPRWCAGPCGRGHRRRPR
ncbi:MAG: AMP-binding protein [Acidimicrobiales bacterium]